MNMTGQRALLRARLPPSRLGEPKTLLIARMMSVSAQSLLSVPFSPPEWWSTVVRLYTSRSTHLSHGNGATEMRLQTAGSF